MARMYFWRYQQTVTWGYWFSTVWTNDVGPGVRDDQLLAAKCGVEASEHFH